MWCFSKCNNAGFIFSQIRCVYRVVNMLNSYYVPSAGLSAWYVLSFTHHIHSINYILCQSFGEINSPICTTNVYYTQTAFSVFSDYSVCCMRGGMQMHKREFREFTLNMWGYFLLLLFYMYLLCRFEYKQNIM